MPRLSTSELEARTQGMGSTDIVEVLGLSPWRNAGPMRVYMAKTRQVLDDEGTEDDDEEIDELEWGHVMEPVILAEVAKRRGWPVIPCGQVECPGEPWMWATLDAAIVGEAEILEIKNVGCPRLYRHWDVSDPDGIPRYVRAQVTIAMLCRSAKRAHVCASIGGRPPHVWTIEYDAELARLLVQGGRKFWFDHVIMRQRPPLDHTDATRAYLKATYPSNEDRVIVQVDDESLNAKGRRRAEVAALLKSLENEKKMLDAFLLNNVANRDGITGDGWQMTWKVNKNGDRRQRFTANED
jgi:putative phage-type endonuclease